MYSFGLKNSVSNPKEARKEGRKGGRRKEGRQGL